MELVLKLGAEAALRICFLTGVLSANLVCDAQMLLVLRGNYLRLVHLDGRRHRALSLIHDLNLALANLDGVVRVLPLGSCTTHFLLILDLW